ncbi:hypothetical protein CDL12_16448 [Handroanthus impetiginosus]|uniref:Uncharacterized protein n=1 Tax=Handroanthus impetiginosus TaxID=429701 RepID=A0A2G9H0A5_9LAMI|nr:hypothetical protein CDL12_16448 [Handroanthus impetiginosus]
MARYHHSSYYDYLQYFSFSIHFSFFLAIVFIFLIFNWYINYESTFEDFMDNFKICLMVFPVVLLLFVHWLSSDDRERVPFDLSLPEKDSFHRVGGSPVGVAILLMFLIFMIPHHSSLQEKWFPLFSRR